MYARGFSWTFKASDPDHGFESITFVNAQTCLKDIATVEQCAVHPSKHSGGYCLHAFPRKICRDRRFFVGWKPFNVNLYAFIHLFIMSFPWKSKRPSANRELCERALKRRCFHVTVWICCDLRWIFTWSSCRWIPPWHHWICQWATWTTALPWYWKMHCKTTSC